MLLLLGGMPVAAQNFSSLWKEVRAAREKDLPKSELDWLGQIERKAEGEKAWGHLLAAETRRAQVVAMISADSLAPALETMEQRARGAKEPVVTAIRWAVLAKIYSADGAMPDEAKAEACAQKALNNPDLLASAKVGQWEPLAVSGQGQGVFGGDMLSVVGYELGRLSLLYDYYSSKGNRRAACLSALEACKRGRRDQRTYDINKSPYIHLLDSILDEYGDQDVAGEVAVERYEAMKECAGVGAEQRIGYINYALERWGSWPRMAELINERRLLTAPMLNMSAETTNSRPGEPIVLRIDEARAVSELVVKVYGLEAEGDVEADPMTEAGYKALKTLMDEAPRQVKTLRTRGMMAYETFSDSIVLSPMPVGVYLMEITTSPATETRRILCYVSDNCLLSEALPGDKIRYVALSSTTGHPLKGAKIRLAFREAGGQSDQYTYETIECDEDGEVVYQMPITEKGKTQKPTKARLFTCTDKASTWTSGTGRFSMDLSDGKRDITRLYADRSIYRPGQTIKAAAMAYRQTSWTDAEAVAGKNISIKLKDPSGRVVGQQEGTTDSYGAMSADLQIPSGGLTGRYTLETTGTRLSIRVEQYKRPTFKVEFPDVNTKYQAGDTLLIRAKAVAYSGMPVQGAKVSCKIYRREALWWRLAYRRMQAGMEPDDVLLDEQTTITDGSGRFDVELPLVMPETGEDRGDAFYNFIVEASVCDISGETHEAQMSVPLGGKQASISLSIGDKELGDSLSSLTVWLKNRAGLDVNTAVRLRIDDYGDWIEGRTMQPISLPSRLKSGKHSVYVLCDNDTLRHDFTVFSLDDKRPPVETHDWFYVSADKFADYKTPVTVQVGTSERDVHVVYSILSGENIVESGSFKLDNSTENRRFRYKEEWGNGLLLTYAWVKNGEWHSHSKKLQRPTAPRNLNLKWTTFRDRLVPGEQETWTLSISDPDGKPADAALIATIYDASLDGLYSHEWSLPGMATIPTPTTKWTLPRNTPLHFVANAQVSLLKWQPFEPAHFNQEMFPSNPSISLYGLDHTRIMRAKGVASALTEDAVAVSLAAAEEEGGEEDDGLQTMAEESIRENFDETAFFSASLTTNREGQVDLTFTLPEALTTWRFLGLAHTQDMKTGLMEDEAVAQKEVMATAHLPRFVRVGDKARLGAKVANTANSRVKGHVSLTLEDAETGRVVMRDRKPFDVDIDNTTQVEFQYEPDGSTQLLVCRMVAEGTNESGRPFSDGEQHYLPVMPNRERVVKTRTFTQTGPGTERIDIGEMLTVKDETTRLSIEYTTNPAWLAVEALPYVANKCDEGALGQATALYVGTIGNLLAQGDLRELLGRWSQEEETSALVGQLERNVELRDIVADETPWVGEAETESESRRIMASFLDAHSLEALTASAEAKLERLQNPDGSWSWWPGMDGNVHMTAEVAMMLSRLCLMTGANDSIVAPAADQLERALKYLDAKMAETVARLRDQEADGVSPIFPGKTALKYLYVNALLHRTLAAKAQDASTYLADLLKKQKGLTIHDKAMAAIVMKGLGEEQAARDYAQSLREYAVEDEEMGIYYETIRAPYSWRDYRIPTQTAAIEALRAIEPDNHATIDGMKLWLLQEKRTQMWDTPIVSADAVYALLFDEEGHVDMGSLAPVQEPRITIDGRLISLPEKDGAEGSIRLTLSMNDASLSKTSKIFEATNTGGPTSWGAIYAQYMQEAESIEDYGDGLSIKREIVEQETGGRGGANLQVGDKVKVILTITAHRDLDFVEVRDKRAAAMEPVEQLSGYRNGYYCTPRDNATNYYFDSMPKGTYRIETEYFLSRAGTYETGSATVCCAYAPEYRAATGSTRIDVGNNE